MKNNSENLKKYLILALQNTPQDFVFENIKPLLRSALSIVEKVEKKRTKREQNNIINNSYIPTTNTDQLKNILNNLDGMIKEQEKKLQSFKKDDNQSNSNNSVLND